MWLVVDVDVSIFEPKKKNVRPLFRLRFVNQLTKFEKTRMWDCEELSLHPSPHSSYLIIALIKVFKGGKRRFSEYLKKECLLKMSLGWHSYQLSTKQRLVPVSSNPPRTKMPHVKWGCCLPCKIILPLNNESIPIRFENFFSSPESIFILFKIQT